MVREGPVIRLLLVDDFPVVREGLRVLLEAQQDLEVVGQAGSGLEAFRQVLKLHPDVVIMDISMPEMNGIEATMQIHDAAPSTHVVIMSMHSTTEHIFRALQAGATGYLLKDSIGAEVVKAVRAVHAGRRYLSESIAGAAIDDYISGRHHANPLESLSSRERQILQLVVEGKVSSEIGTMLFLSPKTVDTYRSRMMHKLGIRDIPALVKFAIKQGMTQLD